MTLFNLYATAHEPPALTFGVVRGARDRSDPALAGHLRGLQGYVSNRGQRPMSARLMAVLRHVDRVKHHRSVEVADEEVDALIAWAHAANALVFCPDGTLRDPELQIVIAQDPTDEDPDAVVPYPAAAVARKARTMEQLAARDLTVPPVLPPVGAASEVTARAPDAIAARCAALFACALRAESVGAGEPIPSEELTTRLRIDAASLSPREAAFLAAAEPANQDVVQHAWGYEAVAVLLWARGVLTTLPFPDAICDVPGVAQAMLGGEATAPARTHDELLDALDLHYRLHWISTEARVRGAGRPTGFDSGVVFERYRALNWLTGCDPGDWDDVDTPT